MDLMTIGTFAARTRLSPKALRLYDRLGLVPPVRTDPVSGYRFYSEEQVAGARLVALLRRLGMPLPVIADIAAKPAGEASEAVAAYWAGVESVTAERRVLVSYIQARLTGGDMTSYDIQTRTIGERTLLSISRHLHLAETDAFFGDAFGRLRAAGPGVEGIAGCPFLVFYGEVSDDSDGPLELCRPVSSVEAGACDAAGVQVRVEPGHDEVFIRVAMKDMGWPALMPAVDALEAWIREQRREPAGALRQVLIADQRTAAPDTPVCDLSVPLRLRLRLRCPRGDEARGGRQGRSGYGAREDRGSGGARRGGGRARGVGDGRPGGVATGRAAQGGAQGDEPGAAGGRDPAGWGGRAAGAERGGRRPDPGGSGDVDVLRGWAGREPAGRRDHGGAAVAVRLRAVPVGSRGLR